VFFLILAVLQKLGRLRHSLKAIFRTWPRKNV